MRYDQQETVAVEKELRALYLDLLEKTLAFELWPDPGIPIEAMNYRRSGAKSWMVTSLVSWLRPRGLRLLQRRSSVDEQRVEGRGWPGLAHTMVGRHRLDNIRSAVETVILEGVPGDLIETGVWRGGSCILMKGVLKSYGDSRRKVIVADSFRGLPPPDTQTFPADQGDQYHVFDFLAVPKEEVQSSFAKYGLLDERVVFLEGWFKDTLPIAPTDQIAVLRLDGDMYGSTIVALESLYPKLSPGGFCIVDDYALEGCRKAVDDYRRQNDVREEIVPVDWTGMYWRKKALPGAKYGVSS